ncbi:DUF3159 domain-containing protein [Mycobacterium sp. 852014-52144_SCH5372336]|uniref:DUF3159 domain-containing protein n=1 Tax=Mycobacterium sp. 852014-52144_SCH5372336 TaxID=1834115 RepID=UPI0007FCC1C7|nr:DUF3159 domain-containing protein [Mycobacterium sp. 852014-52144_SCH5372336]OBB75883.1 hypothetical protein A5759_06455 [Mycobacterium sp. 852014-52144_SCH5372336]
MTDPALSRNRIGEIVARSGGIRGVIYSAAPVVAYMVAANFMATITATGIAVGVSLLILLWCLWHGDHLRPVVVGFLGTALAAGIPFFTGQSKDFYLPQIWVSLVSATVLVGSVLIGRPLAGYVWAWNGGHGRIWRNSRRHRWYFTGVTGLWALVFSARFLVQYGLYVTDRNTLLGVARLLMGFPLALLASVATVLAIRALHGRETLNTAPSRDFQTTEQQGGSDADA